MKPRSSRKWIAGSLLAVAAVAAPWPASAADEANRPTLSPVEVQARALKRAHAAVVGVHTVAVDDARSASTLGREREGSGVVIDDNVVLTIGYLILEADQVQIEVDEDRTVPARVIAYDVATG